MSESKSTGISRRGILKTFGVGAAALASTPIMTKADSIRKSAISQASGMKAGIIIPGSAAKVNTTAFLNGIDLFLSTYQKEHGTVPFAPIVETAGLGSSSLESAIAKISQHHDIKLVVGYTNSRVTKHLAASMEQQQLPFIEANLGENFFSTDSQYCFNSSLNLWQANYMLGKYAAEHSGKQAVSVGSFYDAAYDAHFAFEAGFIAGGGTVLSQIITGSPADHFSPIEAASLVTSSEANVVFLNYSGSDASIFVSALNRLEGSASKQVYGSGILASPATQSFLAQTADGITVAHSWQASDANSAFAISYKKAYGCRPNDLALLGYETASMVASAVALVGKTASSEKIAAALRSVSFDSPRGTISMSAATQSSEAPISIFKIGGPVISTESIPAFLSSGKYQLTEKMRSGAINIYPFAA